MSFDIPLPANYGGVIDVFYKMKALSDNGVKIIFHAFNLDRNESKLLEKICEKVYYYPRKSFLPSFISIIPFIVKTRSNKSLIENLNRDNYPILFEGIHSTYPLISNSFNSNRLKIIRIHNIEHRYYRGLAKSEKNIFKKIFFISESLKLKLYEKIVNKVDLIFPLSTFENEYYKKKYPDVNTEYLPIFHENFSISNLVNSIGKFALYHGDLRVADNVKAVKFLINIFKNIDYPLVVAGNILPKDLLKDLSKSKNISFINLNNDNSKLDNLFKEAQMNILPSFQKTGIKLKLVNALFKSRFVIGNSFVLKGTGLEDITFLADSKKEFIDMIELLKNKEYSQSDLDKRTKILTILEVQKNIQKVIELL